jgi:hypothetical protein
LANDAIGNTVPYNQCGLECSASSGRLGTSSNPVNIVYQQVSYNYGASWDWAPAWVYHLTDTPGGGYHVTGGWDYPGRTSNNRRNTN